MDTEIKNENHRLDEEISEINDWEDLNAKTELLRGIYASGFEKPSPIQRKAIMPLFSKKDILCFSSDNRHTFVQNFPIFDHFL